MKEFGLLYPGASSRTRVRFDSGGLARVGAFARRITGARRALLVTDTRVGALYGRATRSSLRRAGIEVASFAIPAGERSKNADQLERLWRELARLEFSRADLVVALGGGVVGDLAGFAAASWLRGVPWIAVPTTLLAQVDSGVGGKTAIDLPEGKNLVGAFHQPAGVLIDAATLGTLPARQLRAGLAEVVKMGFAVDARLFRWCEAHRSALAGAEPAALARAGELAVRAKARIVLADEREAGARTALNFGHTLGHAIEAALGYRRLLHGEAIALGMRVAARLSVREVGLPDADRARLEALLDALALPSRLPPLRISRLERAMRVDKKRRGREVRWVLTPRLGFASVPRSIEGRRVKAALKEAGAGN
ncbi:MAG TPA: 3-dehydroquinate synthase [Candidatus Sulfotelmatobacter sp.]|nr:3-dehydroquinate synthase [Candidatus Sulfotelmatobacter sp.]